MKSDLLKNVFKVISDLLCLLVVGIAVGVYNWLNVVPISKTGFFCSDDSIRYPYRNSTLSASINFLLGFCFVIFLALVIETWLYRKHRTSCQGNLYHPLLGELYRVIGYFTFGAAVNQFLTDLCKWSVGRLRPHFIDVCLPNVTCTSENQHVFIENYECLRTRHSLIPADRLSERIDNSKKSFPSGHSSFALYTAVFLTVYLEHRLRSHHTRLLRHLVQTGVMAWALWACSTRISDFKHRYSDVAGGIVLGSTVAAFMILAYIRSRRSASNRDSKKRRDSNPGTPDQPNGTLHSARSTDVSLTHFNAVISS